MVRILNRYYLAVFIGVSFLFAVGCDQEGLTGPGSGQGTLFINGYPDDPTGSWQLTMPDGYVITGVGDTTLSNMPEGNYQVFWSTLEEWHSPDPNPHTGRLSYPLALSLTGIYSPVIYDYPHVPALGVGHALTPGHIEVSWMWYLSGTHPTHHYEIACSHTGPITQENWADSELILSQLHDPRLVGNSCIITPADGLEPGATVWVTVRAVSADGWATHVVESPSITVSQAWWAQGQVVNHLGQPMPGVPIACSHDAADVVSDAHGNYLLGPLVDLMEVVFSVNTEGVEWFPESDGWYNYESTPVLFDGQPQYDILILPRLGMDETCGTFSGVFLDFLRYMTRTDAPGSIRPNQELCSWQEYPVKVFIPDHVRPDGVDFAWNVRQGIQIWNQALGMEILTCEGVTQEQAQVEFYFADLGVGANGIALLVDPPGNAGQLGYLEPNRISIGINDELLPDAQRIQEVSLHEMGHALGLYRHVLNCHASGYLMSITSAGALDDGPLNAIHPDESRAVQVIRHLPRWMDMAGFH